MSDPVCEIVSSWALDEPFDAIRAVESWNGPALTPSEVAALAIAELVDRDETDEEFQLDSFLEKFPSCRDELLHRIGRVKGAVLGKFPKINEIFCGQTIIRYLSLSSVTQVYLAIDSRLSSRLNVIKVTTLATREPSMIARLFHNNIVRLYSLLDGVDSATTTVTLEYVGESANIQHEPRAVQERRFLAIADAIEHMHQRGVVHNDLTIRNVVTTEQDTKVIDFNASVNVGDSGELRPVGTIAYLTSTSLNELLLYQRFISACDVSIDNFAFVVLCYRMLTGKLPWEETISSDTDSVRTLLERRQSLSDSDLEPQQLSRRERMVFCKYLKETHSTPTPTVFVRELISARKSRFITYALATCSLVFLIGTLTWGVLTPMGSVRVLNAGSSNLSSMEGVRSDFAKLFNDNQIAPLLIACYRDRSRLTPKEKAIMAYCIGVSHTDTNTEVILGESVVRSGNADAAVYSNLALAFLKRGDATKAHGHIDAALHLDPKCPQALFHRASALVASEQSDIEQALRAVSETLMVMPREQAVLRLATDVLAKCEGTSDLSDESIRLSEQLFDHLHTSQGEPSFRTMPYYAKPYTSR